MLQTLKCDYNDTTTKLEDATKDGSSTLIDIYKMKVKDSYERYRNYQAKMLNDM